MSKERAAKYYDVSVPIAEGMVTWPSDPPVRISVFKAVSRGDRSNLLKMEMGTHTGSHVDAPFHVGLERTVDRLSLDALIGPACVITVRSRDFVRAADLGSVDLRRVRRVLFKTRNSARMGDGRFHEDYVALSAEAAAVLARHKVKLVGIDALSVDAKGGKGEAHRALLGAGAVLLENIDLSRVAAGMYELICLPLLVAGADGAPARVLLKKRQ